jgi:hypothetical protein
MTTLPGISPTPAPYLITGLRGIDVVRVRRNSVATAFAAVTRLRELGYRVSVIRMGAAS